ncbi:MAG: RnfH family protein [Burkholderiales bacterium PBB3]|nr:MAG: RnfH family protein [Burkholderiales bacterium PBB3]
MAFNVTLVVSLAPRSVQEMQLSVEEGATASQALRASGLLDAITEAQLQSLELAIWGRQVPGSQVLQADDRLELVRPLLVDPKVARRERFAHQGAKKAGLFKTRRAGGKAGY